MALAAPESSAPRIRVAALIEDAGRVLLVRHRKADAIYYLLPGGGVEAGERLSEALIREVREETGFDCVPTRPALISDSLAPDGSRHMVQIAFEARITGGRLTDEPLDDRVEAAEFVFAGDLVALDLRPPVGAQILERLDGLVEEAMYVAARWVDD